MKKNLLKITALIAALAVPGLALAAETTITTSNTTVLGSQTIAPSNNVSIIVSCPTGVGYGAMAAHSKGDRIFGINSNDTKIYYFTEPTTMPDPTQDSTNFVVTNGSASMPSTSWNSL